MRTPSSAVLLSALLAAMGCRGGTGDTNGDTDTQLQQDSAGGSGPACVDPRPLPDIDDGLTGYVICADGGIDRAEAVAARTDIPGEVCPAGAAGVCDADADCTGGDNGRCVLLPIMPWDDPSVQNCGCRYSCGADTDCAEGQACVTPAAAGGLQWSTCVPAECRTGADCESGRCGVSSFEDDCGDEVALVCRDSEDACVADGDCTSEFGVPQCATNAGQTQFECRVDQCDVGRPLMVADQARTAAPQDREDWRAAVDLDGLDAADRRALSAHWARVAALEHASVASFSRFALQLMALGAPADLLSRTHAAAVDEVRHAELAYGLVSALEGRAVGPGPLDLDDVPLQTTPQAVLQGLITEACLLETLGVSEAREAAAACQVPEIRQILEQIAEDEQEHAALAWASLSWLLERHPEQRDLAARLLSDGVARAMTGRFAGEAEGRPHLGMLGGLQRRRIHRIVAMEVLRPAMKAVLEPAPA